MTDPELEDRLRRMLSGRADQVETQLSGARLRAEAATQQIGPSMHESGEPTGSGDLHPTNREDRIMTVDDLDLSDRTRDELTLVDTTPARRRGRRAAIVSSAALAAAAAAVVAVVVAPGHHGANGGNPVAAGRSASARTTVGTAAGGPYTYVHATFGDGTTTYQDVWIPADPTTGVWQLSRKDDQGAITQRATCARFPFFQGPAAVQAPGAKTPAPKTPPCDASSGWDGPYRPPFAESLPADAHALLADLRAAAGGSDAETFSLGSGFVATGWVPKDVAGHVLAALKLVPGVVEKSDVSNGAGASGTALTYTGRIKPAVPETWGVIVDPSGQVIGSTFSYSGHPTEVDGITRVTVDAIGDTK